MSHITHMIRKYQKQTQFNPLLHIITHFDAFENYVFENIMEKGELALFQKEQMLYFP